MTGRPRSSGLRRSSTDTKNASMSTWRIERDALSSATNANHGNRLPDPRARTMKGRRREEVAVTFDSLLAKVGESFHAKRAFGPVIEADGCQIIPVALCAGGGGGGEGTSGDEPSPGDGFGGGFGGVSWPLGVYVVKDGTAKWVPAIDATRIALGVLAAVRVALRLRARRAR